MKKGKSRFPPLKLKAGRLVTVDESNTEKGNKHRKLAFHAT